VTDDEIQGLIRQNAALKLRNTELEADVIDLSAQVTRLQHQNQHFSARRLARRPDPLPGDQ